MPATLTQAHDQILTLLRARLPSLHIRWPDMPGASAKPPQSSWARVTLSDEGESRPPPLVGSVGNRRYSTEGILTVEIYALGGDGRRAAQTLAETVLRTYRGRRTSGGVWFRRERVRDVGPDGTYYQVNVLVEYQYDTIETGTERAIGGAVALAGVEAAGAAGVEVGVSGGATLGALSATGDSTVEDVFHPSQVASISAWLRNTTLSGNISSVADQLNTNPAVQGTDARRPTGNADGSMTFTAVAPDVLSWPITAENSPAKFGLLHQIKPATVSAGQLNLITVRTGTGGASANRYSMRTNNTGLILLLYVDGTNGRFASVSGVLALNEVRSIYTFFDKDAGAESDIFKVFVDGVQQSLSFGNLGTGAALSAGLTAGVTGNILLGNLNDGAASGAYGGDWSRNTYVLTDPLTTQELADLDAYEPLAA